MPKPDRATLRVLFAGFGVFIVMLLAAAGALHLRERGDGLLTSGRLISLKAELEQSPNNEALKAEIREVDQLLRQQYFSVRRQYRIAGYLLLVAVIGFLLTGKKLLGSDPVVFPELPIKPQPHRRRNARRAVAGVCVAMFAILAWGAVSHGLILPPAGWMPEPAAVEAPREPSFDDVWPGFRGPGNLGVAGAGDWPTTWSLAAGTNIEWSSDVPSPGRSSPVLTREFVYLTGERDGVPRAMCFDRVDGRLLWDNAVRPPRPGAGDEYHSDAGLASSTPVTDGRNLYAMFGNGWLVGFDSSGSQLWLLDLGPIDSIYGFASSLLIDGSRVIVQLDQGSDPDANLSSILAVDTETGGVVWETPREVINTWSTPALLDSGGRREIVASGEPHVIAYDPQTGEELWRYEGMRGEICPSPAAGGGRVFIGNYPAGQVAIELGGSGDITETHLSWSNDLAQPDLISPVSDGLRVLHVVASDALCFDAQTGEQLWTSDLDGMVIASPILAGDRVYLTSLAGTTWIIDWRQGFAQAGEGTLDENVEATPAFGDGRIYFRTEHRLVAVRQTP